MTTIKLFYLIPVLASALAASEEAEWRYFSGLLFGSALAALAGMALILLPGRAVPRQIIHARLLANGVFGIGLGAILLYVALDRGWHVGPLFTVGAGFVGGIFGVGLIKLVEPVILRRVQSRLDAVLPEDRLAVTPRPEPPTVRLAQPDKSPPSTPL